MGRVKYRKHISAAFSALAGPVKNNGRVSLGMENSVGEFFYLKIADLLPFKNQAREVFNSDEISSLSESIKHYGVRQPITVMKSLSEPGKFEIISGERRTRAAKLAGLEKIPCIVLDSNKQAEIIAVIENLHRVDLHPVELARAYKSLLNNGAFDSAESLFNALGVNRSAGYEILKLLELPVDEQRFLLQNNIRNREQIRALFKNQQSTNIEKKIHSSGSVKSVMRISANIDGDFVVQTKKLEKLSDEEKTKLKTVLEKLLKSL